MSAETDKIAKLEADLSFQRNETNWLLETLKAIANTLELPYDKTMASLPEHAVRVMAELKLCRQHRLDYRAYSVTSFK